MATNEELQQQLDALREELRLLRGQLPSSTHGAQRRRCDEPPYAAARGPDRRRCRGGRGHGRQPGRGSRRQPGLARQGQRRCGCDYVDQWRRRDHRQLPALRYNGGLGGDSATIVSYGAGSQIEIGVGDRASDQSFSLGAYAGHFVGGAGSGLASGGQDAVRIDSLGPGTALTIVAHDQNYAVEFGGQPEPSIAVLITAETGPGVSSTVTRGVGVAATCDDGQAITAVSTSATTGKDAVTIDYAGTGRALYAQSHNPANINGTVTGSQRRSRHRRLGRAAQQHRTRHRRRGGRWQPRSRGPVHRWGRGGPARTRHCCDAPDDGEDRRPLRGQRGTAVVLHQGVGWYRGRGVEADRLTYRHSLARSSVRHTRSTQG